MSVRFCLSYDPLNWDFVVSKLNVIATRKCSVDKDIVNIEDLTLVVISYEIYETRLSKVHRFHMKLDYQVSICSLIPPARAISKTQDRADTSVWWKLPFSIFFIIYYVQSAIINKVCKPELWFLCSAHPIIVLYICMKFHENISNDFEGI